MRNTTQFTTASGSSRVAAPRRRMPVYFNEAQRKLATFVSAALPLAVPAVLALMPPLSGVTLYVTAAFWLALAFAPLRFSVPSLFLLNLYRKRLVEATGSRFPTAAMFVRSDCQLRSAMWLNLAATVVSAVVLVALYL